MKCPKCGAELPDGSKFCHFCGPLTKPVQRRRGKGEGSAYKRGRTWEAAVVVGWRLNDEGKAVPDRRTKGGFRTKKEALAYLPELRREKKRTVPTVEDLWNQFQQGGYKKITPSRQEKYRIAWPKLESIRYTRIDQLTTADLQAVVSQAATFYPARDIRDLLSKLYQLALPDQFVSSNLADFLVLPDANEAKQDAFTDDEVLKLWKHYADGNWWTGYILLMCYTAMMPGELMSTRKDMIDWEGKQIVGAGKKTKTRKTVPIVLADAILPVLEDLCEHTPGEKLIRINKDRFYKVYYETVEAAGVRRLRPYDCRHTAATAMAKEGIPPSVIQKVMRHAKFSSTERYIHIDTDPMHDAVNRLSIPQS